MYIVNLYLHVRKACLVDGMSVREASRVFGVHRDTVNKMLANPVPPGYRRKRPPRRPKLEPYTGAIDRILEDDPVSQYGAGSERAEEAAPHDQAHLRAAEGRVRVRRWLHHSQGLRAGTTGDRHVRCSCRLNTHRATPSATSARLGRPSEERGAGFTTSLCRFHTATASS